LNFARQHVAIAVDLHEFVIGQLTPLLLGLALDLLPLTSNLFSIGSVIHCHSPLLAN
jgi:hypothetical protein